MKRPILQLISSAVLFSALALLPATPALSAGPSFDCAKATRQIDRAICAWDTVGSLDERMAAAYKQAIAVQQGEAAIASVRANQKAWLAERDNRCGVDKVAPREGSKKGLNPQEFGQLMCLQAIYPARIAQLMDIAAAPLVPLDVKTMPIEPLKAAYPEDWQEAGYQAQFSSDKTLMALGVEDSAGYVMQVWLYQPTTGRLVVASPRTHKGPIETPEDIADLRPWIWGSDGRFYVEAHRPLGQSTLFGANMDGHAMQSSPPPDVAERLAEFEAARKAWSQSDPTPKRNLPPGFDDNSYDEQEGGAFVAWAQNKGHGSFELRAARDGDEEPRIIASGGWELRDLRLDPNGKRLFYNGDDGLVVSDPDTGVTRRLKGTHGTPAEVRPINLSADGSILIYSTSGTCAHDAADDSDLNANDDADKRVCLAYLPNDSKTSSAATPVDPWIGEWHGSGAGYLSASIRRGTAKPDYLVIDLYTGTPGCTGAVTLYGKPDGTTLLGESDDPDDPGAPVCRVEFSLDDHDLIKTEVAGPCSYYHGGSCDFDGTLTR